jgi:hypothetical protein
MRERWNRHSVLLAHIANQNPYQKRAQKPERFNPYHVKQSRRRSDLKVPMGAIMDAMFDRNTKRLEQYFQDQNRKQAASHG